tara:strand:- start:225 stop:449 length:225 start_codon:yes stop_codon:yes gene_type:complete
MSKTVRVEGTDELATMFVDYIIEYNYYEREERTPLKYQTYRLISELYERGILEAELTQKNGWVFHVKEPKEISK